uniref:C-type lectin domain-containing protein n=1 Tax=Haemonchus contortus TaxID=6289 RepID=A0A7I4YLZ4_HAECO
MGRATMLTVVSLAITVLHPATAIRFFGNDEEVAQPTSTHSSKGAHQSSNVHQSKEWVAGPNGYLYQFHAGDQSWLAAREFCLSQNSDLVVLRDAEQIDWLLSHYAPTYARFAERYIQVGLMIPDGPSRDWMYLDGSKYNQSVISWMSGEPFDHSTDGLERCALLRIHARVLDDVDCEATTRNQMPVRFICERSSKRHKQQQLSKNFLWGKLEQIFELLGFGATTPAKKVNSTDTGGEDYVEEVTKLNITSSEREILKKIRVFETSSEEEREVLMELRKLNKPGTIVTTPSSSDLTTPEVPQKNRPQTSTEIKITDSVTEEMQSNTEEPTTATTAGELTTSAIDDRTESDSKTEEEATNAPTTEDTEETRQTIDESTATSKADEETTEPSKVEESTNEVSTTSENSSERLEKEKSTNATPVRAHAVPLREIPETEGSGTTVEENHIEKESSKIQREIDPKKLDEIIRTMENMVAKLENISIVEKPQEKKAELKNNLIEEEKGNEDKDLTEGTSQKKETRKKDKATDSLVSLSEAGKEEGAGQADMEKDFDEKMNKNLPTTDIKPPGDDDCDEEGSGATTQSPSDPIIRNVIDTEDVDDLSQKPKIPAGKEQHIEEFLRTLRTFLSRAQHSDLRKLLDNDPDKSLLEKMKLAIAAANDREYARLRELELMKKHGVDISNVPEPQLIGESEREDLFKKISGVVMEEAEKNELEAATEPSARTTTQEKFGSTTKAEETTDVKKENSQEHTTENNEKEVEEKDSDGVKATKTEELPATGSNSDSSLESGTVKSAMENATNVEESLNDETTPEPKTSAEMPARTVQLKEFENKEEIMSNEVKNENKSKEGEEEEVKTEPISKEQDNSSGGSDKGDGQSEESTTAKHENPREEKPKEDKANEDQDKELTTSSAPLVTTVEDDDAVEVGTEKTPEAKKAQRKVSKEVKEEEDSSEEDDRDSTNPLGLPTLPPPPTLAPLPNLETVLENLGMQWRKLFTPPKLRL